MFLCLESDFGNGGVAGLEGGDGGFNLFGDFGQGGRAVVGGELDSVVFGGIVGGGEVDGAGGFEGADGIGDGWRGGGVGDDDGGDAGGGEDAGGFGHEGLAEEAGIAADEHAVGLGLGFDVGGDAGDGQADVGHGELFGYDRAPTGCAELDCCRHRLLQVRRVGRPQSPYCNMEAGWASWEGVLKLAVIEFLILAVTNRRCQYCHSGFPAGSKLSYPMTLEKNDGDAFLRKRTRDGSIS